MMNKFAKKAIMLEELGKVVVRIEDDIKWTGQRYECVDEENGKWDYVDIPAEEMDENRIEHIEAMRAIIKHLEKLL